MYRWAVCLLVAVSAVLCISLPAEQEKSVATGIFNGHQDVGTVLNPGSTAYDPATQTYTVKGSGENMWFGRDDFQFAWKKMSGNVAISADIAFVGTKGNNHRKAVLMIRQTLDGDSPAIDIARHGDGLTSLQFRDASGVDDREVQSNIEAPKRLRLEKRGDYFYAFVSGQNGKLQAAGTSIKVVLNGPFYVGIGVCAHDKDATETAVFSNVKIEPLVESPEKGTLYSTLETVPIDSMDRRVTYVAQAHFEAPNWSRDGSFLIFNQDGGLYKLPLSGGEPVRINTDSQIKCNNDHGISPDGTMLAISDSTETGNSLVYTLPISGGKPRKITPTGPSYWHGWSPDGATLAFVGERKGNFDIYSVAAKGGQERRLTTAPALDDGPEYSPDGQWIYFNSERTGHMQIWRMHPDGGNQEQVIRDDTNDWFPHISPDGKWMIFLSYESGVSGHPPDKDVALHLVSLADGSNKILAKLFGGQGTINVPSWSPDSKRVAFVSYEYLPSTPRD